MAVLDYARSTAPLAPSAAYQRGVRHIRRAVLITLAAGGAWYLGFLAYRVRQRLVDGEWRWLFQVEAAFFAIVLALIGVTWWAGPPAVRLGFSILHAVAGWRVPRREWNDAAFDALWRLPWATAAAAVVLFVYWALELAYENYGVPALGTRGDLIAGFVGNALGAWCYLPILWRWGKLVVRPRNPNAPPRA